MNLVQESNAAEGKRKRRKRLRKKKKKVPHFQPADAGAVAANAAAERVEEDHREEATQPRFGEPVNNQIIEPSLHADTAATQVLHVLHLVRKHLLRVKDQILVLSSVHLGDCVKKCIMEEADGDQDDAPEECSTTSTKRMRRSVNDNEAESQRRQRIRKLVDDARQFNIPEADHVEIELEIDLEDDKWGWNENVLVESSVKLVVFSSANTQGFDRTFKYQSMIKRLDYITAKNPQTGGDYNRHKLSFGNMVTKALEDRAKIMIPGETDEIKEIQKKRQTAWLRTYRESLKQGEVYHAFLWFADMNESVLHHDLDWKALSTSNVPAHKFVSDFRHIFPNKTNFPPVILGYLAEMEETSCRETTADDDDDRETDEEEDVAEEESDFGEAEQSSDGESSTETDDASFESLHE
jgi:hypothetical protein